MPFPTILGVRHSHVTANATSITILLPDGSNVSGYLVILCVTKDGTGAMTWPAGWTALNEGNDGDSNSRTACRYRILDGTEGFDGVDDSISVSGASEEWAASAITLSAWHGTTAPELAAEAFTSLNYADPPLLNPAGWGTESTLWIVYAGVDGPSGITGWPTNYTDNQHGDDTGGEDAVGHGFATRTNAVASENPSAFTHPAASSVAYTIAVRPSALNTQTLAATLASVSIITPLFSVFRELAGLLASIPNMIAQQFVATTLAVTSTTITLITRIPSKLVAATLASGLTITPLLSVFRVLAASTVTTVLTTNAFNRVLAATSTTIGLLTRVPSKLLAATTLTTALVTSALSKVLAATTLTIALMTSGIIKVLAATLTGIGLLHALKRIAQDRQGRWRPRFLIRMDWP